MEPLQRRILADGRILELWVMIFNVRITITTPEDDGISYEDMWCYKMARRFDALSAFFSWDGVGEPPGWNKHPPTGRWREDGTPASEINQRG